MHTLNITTVLFSFLLFCSSGLHAQTAEHTERSFATDILKQDLYVLHETLTELDPALYRYKTKRQVDSVFNSLSNAIKKPMTESQYKRDIILPAVVSLQDLHFVVYPSVEAEKYLEESGDYFPFDVKIVDGRVYVWHNMSQNTEIADKGRTEILKIDGTAVSDILNKLQNYIVADGTSTTTKRIRDLEQSFRSYYSIVYGRPDIFSLSVKPPGEKPRKINVAASNWNTIEQIKKERYTDQPELLALEFIDSIQTAILTLRTFDPQSISVSDKFLERFIDSTFALIHHNQVKKLILDLRGNYGGRMNYGGQVYSHLTATAFKYLDRVEVKFPHIFPSIIYTSLGKNFLTNTYGMHFDEVRNGDSIYVWETYQWTFEQQPAKTPFTGRLFVLTDGYTISTTGLLASMLRLRNNTIFVGEETGSAYEGCSGNLSLLTLPNTKIRVHFPLRKFVSPAKNHPEKNKGLTSRGVIPDVMISPTIEQLTKNEDAVMIKAIGLTKSTN